MIGVGADILLYGTLVLLYHTDIKIAIPTSVILMAFTSVVGAGCSILAAVCSPAGRASIVDVFPVLVGGGSGRGGGGTCWAAWFHVSFPVVLFWPPWPSSACSQYCWTCYHEHLVGWALVLAAWA